MLLLASKISILYMILWSPGKFISHIGQHPDYCKYTRQPKYRDLFSRFIILLRRRLYVGDPHARSGSPFHLCSTPRLQICTSSECSSTLIVNILIICREKPQRPFRCLDSQYRRELVRVYLTNVEGICRRFVEEKRERLSQLREDPASFRSFW